MTAPGAEPPAADAGSLPEARLRRARVGAALLFLVNGAVFANLLPRLPEIKEAFELSNTVFGLVVIAFPLGSVLAGTAPAPILRRLGSGRAAVIGSAAIAGMIAIAGISGGMGGGTAVLLAYVLPLMLAGMLDAVTDTAQNAQALDVQRGLGRSIINAMHALWSLGSVIGGLMGTAALALQVPLALHLVGSGLLFTVVAVIAGRMTLTQREAGRIRGLETETSGDAGGGTPVAAPPSRMGSRAAVGTVLLIVVIAITGAMVEDLGQNWSALYLRQELDASAVAAGLGLVAMMTAQFAGRLLGDPLIDRLGRVAMARIGTVVIAAGLLLVILAPAPAVGILGFFLAGFGSATLVPSAYAAADQVPGLRPGTGLAVVSWLMRGAFLTLSPFVGVVSDLTDLRLALLVVPLAAVIAMLAAGVLREQSAARGGERD